MKNTIHAREQSNTEEVRNIHENIGGMKRGPIRAIWEDILLLFDMMTDSSAAWSSRAIAIGALGYLVSPIDAIPDLIPFVGLTDDVGVIVAAVGALAFDLAKYRAKRNSKQE